MPVLWWSAVSCSFGNLHDGSQVVELLFAQGLGSLEKQIFRQDWVSRGYFLRGRRMIWVLCSGTYITSCTTSSIVRGWFTVTKVEKRMFNPREEAWPTEIWWCLTPAWFGAGCLVTPSLGRACAMSEDLGLCPGSTSYGSPVLAQGTESLSFPWKARADFLTLGFSLPNPNCSRHLGSEVLMGEFSLSFSLPSSLSFSPFQINERIWKYLTYVISSHSHSRVTHFWIPA